MKFSLIISTLGRKEELVNLFESLQRQDEKDFEVILVDQNDAGFLKEISSIRWNFPLTHVRKPGQRGASRGRNSGVEYAIGDFLLFPDDDCWYPNWFLTRALDLFEKNRCDILVGRAAEPVTARPVNGRFCNRPVWVNRENVFKTQIEWVACFKRELFLHIGGFDEDVGTGSSTPWQSSEGPEITLRAIESGHRVYYSNEFYGYHKELEIKNPNAEMIKKGRAYARGYGYVMVKHNYRLYQKAMIVLKPLFSVIKSLIELNSRAAKYHANVILGRYEGLGRKLIG